MHLGHRFVGGLSNTCRVSLLFDSHCKTLGTTVRRDTGGGGEVARLQCHLGPSTRATWSRTGPLFSAPYKTGPPVSLHFSIVPGGSLSSPHTPHCGLASADEASSGSALWGKAGGPVLRAWGTLRAGPCLPQAPLHQCSVLAAREGERP